MYIYKEEMEIAWTFHKINWFTGRNKPKYAFLNMYA
jgi:hypothetical protein